MKAAYRGLLSCFVTYVCWVNPLYSVSCVRSIREAFATISPIEAAQQHLRNLLEIEFSDNRSIILGRSSNDSLESRLVRNLTAGERARLEKFLKDKIDESRKLGEPFRQLGNDNADHIDLHLAVTDSLGPEGFEEYFAIKSPKVLYEIARIQALAHDLGKIGIAAGWISPNLKRAYEEIFGHLGSGRILGSERFRKETIMTHGITSLDIIDTFLREFADREGWSDVKTETVIRDLQLSTARHNAGYKNLFTAEGKNPNGEFHFWHTMWPAVASLFRRAGYDVPDQPPPSVGFLQSFLALNDRGTASDISFVRKVISEGSVRWNNESLIKFLSENGRSIVREMDSILEELKKYQIDPEQELPFIENFRAQSLRQIKWAEDLRQIKIPTVLGDHADPSKTIYIRKGEYLFRVTENKVGRFNEGSQKWEDMTHTVNRSIVDKGQSAILFDYLLNGKLP